MVDVINRAFESLIFTKAEEKEGYSVYAAGIASGLAGGSHRYVLAFVPNHLSNKKQCKIYELNWINIQTRQLLYSYRMKSQIWTIPTDINDVLLSVSHRDKDYSMYSSNFFPFDVKLLHDPKRKTQYQYNNKLFLTAALSTFQCVIDYKEPIHKNAPTPANWFTIEQQEYELL